MNRWIRWLSLLLAAATLALVFIGGLVTSTRSGLAVPDWPLSYGRLMPPMVGGIFFEHGHRLVAASVGFLTWALAGLVLWKDPRPAVRRLALAAAGLVLLQGLLGGLTVLLRLPKAVSIAHAFTAQAFFALTVVLALEAAALPRPAAGGRPTLLEKLCRALVASLFVQLALGATVRHTGHALPWHIGGALVVFALWACTAAAARLSPTASAAVRRASFLGLAGVLVQSALGIATYWAVGHGGLARAGVPVVTTHVAVGALLLGLAVFIAVRSHHARETPAEGASLSGKGTKSPLGDYFTLTKPGISFMTGVTALTGFVLGSRGGIDATRLVHTVIGTCLVSAGACALNMLLEMDEDARMRRTEARPLPARRLLPGEALLFGMFLAAVGLVYLSATVNAPTALLAGLTLSVYLYVYTPLKKVTALCTAVGAVAGALPALVGWAAASGSLRGAGWTLFAVLFFWQYPHFLALAWLYREDYARAGFSMLSVTDTVDGRATARGILLHSAALLAASLLPAALGLTGPAYAVTAALLGAGFLVLGWGFFRERTAARARRVFLGSVLYLPVLMAALILGRAPVVP
jgi:protoheme IX farnesyltransferase